MFFFLRIHFKNLVLKKRRKRNYIVCILMLIGNGVFLGNTKRELLREESGMEGTLTIGLRRLSVIAGISLGHHSSFQLAHLVMLRACPVDNHFHKSCCVSWGSVRTDCGSPPGADTYTSICPWSWYMPDTSLLTLLWPPLNFST